MRLQTGFHPIAYKLAWQSSQTMPGGRVLNLIRTSNFKTINIVRKGQNYSRAFEMHVFEGMKKTVHTANIFRHAVGIN